MSYSRVVEDMKCEETKNGKINYYPTESILSLTSYYLMVKLPAVSVKKEYSDTFGLTWNIPKLQREIIKEVQILEAGVVRAIYTSDYLAVAGSLNNSHIRNVKEFNFPTTGEEFTFCISAYEYLLKPMKNIDLQGRIIQFPNHSMIFQPFNPKFSSLRTIS